MHNLAVSSETVKKPKIFDFDVYKLLILLVAKLLKSQFLDFFDTLSVYLKNILSVRITDIVNYHRAITCRTICKNVMSKTLHYYLNQLIKISALRFCFLPYCATN